jgi:hypothetical protein
MYSLQTTKDPLNVFRFIASGVFGSLAFSGGVPMAFRGIGFHYIIAAGWTILFFWLEGRFLFVTTNWIISGVIYGIFVWLMMNLDVVPLSLVPMKASPRELVKYPPGCTYSDCLRWAAGFICRRTVSEPPLIFW